MNQKNNHPMNHHAEAYDKLQTASMQSIGLTYLLTRAIMQAEENPGECSPTENEREGIEMLTITCNSELSDAVKRILSIPRCAVQTGGQDHNSEANGTLAKNAPESNSSRDGAVSAHSRGESPATDLQGCARGKTARDGEGGAA